MAIKLIIKGTPISIPSSGASAGWAPGVIEAIQALTAAVNSVTGTYDVAPQVQNIDANNNSTNVSVNNLFFPVTEVRSATIYYSVYRKTENSGPADGQEISEGGTIQIVYNSANPIGNKWEIVQQKAGEGNITFSITDTGQVQFTTTALTGISHQGKVSFRALAILNS